ncbi:MAG TPA: ABC transporter ATP-binding protein [Pseudolysinimonas sp.]|nr:ABC transporter ATP-binding protein [Pseudolysinimonas sp.]
MIRAARETFSLLTPRERMIYVVIVGARALVGFLDVLGILLVGVVAALGATQFTGGKSLSFLGFTLPDLDHAGLLWLVVFVLLVFVVKAIIAIALSRLLTAFIARIEARNAQQLTAHLLGGTLENVRRMSKADFQFALTESTKWTFTGVLNNIASIVVEGFLLLVVAAAFIVVDPVVALFALLYFALIVIGMQAGIARILKRAGEDAAASTVETVGSVSDTIDSFREISVLGRGRLYLDRLAASRTRLARSSATLAFLGGMPRFVIETALILGVVLFVGQQLLANQLADGLATLGVFLGGAVRIMGAILPLQTAVAALKVNTEQSSRARALLREVRADAAARSADDVTAQPAPAAIPHDGPLGIDLDDLGYTYPGEKSAALTGVTLTIEPGSFVALVGPSGAGKSTLAEVILGLARPTSGTVRIGGTAPLVLRAAAPGAVSYVPQRPGMVSGTIAENVALGIEADEIDRDRVREVLGFAQLSDFIATLPDGIDTSVGKQADAFSGGQIQRIGLARALYSQPSLLVLDEATSGLDAGTESVISESLQKLRGSTTLVVIAHRLSTVQHADVVFVVEAGRITASGDFPTVRRDVPMVAEYVKLMSFDKAAT